MGANDGPVRLDGLREKVEAVHRRTVQQRERASCEVQQHLVDLEVRATRAALLRHTRRHSGSDTGVLFDTEFLTVADEPATLVAIMRAARAITDSCDLQLRDPRDGPLRIRAQHGLTSDFLTAFQTVTADDPTACAAALATGRPVVIEDVTSSPILAGHPSLDVLLAAGSRSVASYPLCANDGAVFGVLSFHHHSPHPDNGDSEALVARGAALALIRFHHGLRCQPTPTGSHRDDP